MQQLSLFDTLRSPAIRKPVVPHGGVVQGEPDAVYRLRHPRLAWDRATIELHQHTDGLWMWSASFYCDNYGGSYRVGPKWGRFAQTRDDALFYAASEIEDRLKSRPGKEAALVLAWIVTLKENPKALS